MASRLYENNWIKPILKKQNELLYRDDYGDVRSDDFDVEINEFVIRNLYSIKIVEYDLDIFEKYYSDLDSLYLEKNLSGNENYSVLFHRHPVDDLDESLGDKIIDDINRVLISFEGFCDQSIDMELSVDNEDYSSIIFSVFEGDGWECSKKESSDVFFYANKNDNFLVVCCLMLSSVLSSSVLKEEYLRGLNNDSEVSVFIVNTECSEDVLEYAYDNGIKIFTHREIWDFLENY